MSESIFAGSFPRSEAIRLDQYIAIGDDAVVSKTIAKSKSSTLTLFGFDAGQGLSEHTAPFDAFIQVLEGEVELTIGGENVIATAGQSVLMPANIPHAVNATTPMKMLLTMLREVA